MMGGSSKTYSEPWKDQQSYLRQGFIRADQLLDGNLDPKNLGGFLQKSYGGPLVADVSQAQQNAWDMTAQRAAAGSGNLNAAKAYNQGILNGDFTALAPMINRAQQGVNSTYALGGRYGSGSHDAATTEAIGNVIANAQGQQAALAPSLAQADYLDAAKLAEAGQQQMAYQQSQIDAAKKKFEFDQQAPAQALADYMALINGSYGSTNSQKSNPLLTGAGLGLGLLGMF
jgi:hypothetical protein